MRVHDRWPQAAKPLFERRGREYYGYPAAEAKIQDETADILLPPLPAMAHHR